MIYVSVQPDHQYFHWQVELYINNFKSVGINPNKIEVIFLYDVKPSNEVLLLQQKYNTVRFFFYQDDRPDKSYIPSIKPYGLFKHLQQFPELNTQAIFYHDSDIILREMINENLFINDDTWYLSDTVSYIGFNYCKSKGIEQLLEMLDIVKIDYNVVKSNQKNSGGAQYIIKKTKPSFWYKVYEDSISLYKLMSDYEHLWTSSDDHPIQKWCAEMWSTLWNAWLFKYNTEIHEELNFSFATDHIDNWYKKKILHNAGVNNGDEGLFYKGSFIDKSPFYESHDHVNPNTCSSVYVTEIKKLSKPL